MSTHNSSSQNVNRNRAAPAEPEEHNGGDDENAAAVLEEEEGPPAAAPEPAMGEVDGDVQQEEGDHHAPPAALREDLPIHDDWMRFLQDVDFPELPAIPDGAQFRQQDVGFPIAALPGIPPIPNGGWFRQEIARFPDAAAYPRREDPMPLPPELNLDAIGRQRSLLPGLIGAEEDGEEESDWEEEDEDAEEDIDWGYIFEDDEDHEEDTA